MDLCSETVKQQDKQKQKRTLEQILESCTTWFSSNPSLVGHGAFFLFRAKVNMFNSPFGILLNNLDCFEMHLMCYFQYLQI